MKAKIEIFFKGCLTPTVLVLPSRYQSEQWLSQVCETLEDAEGVTHVQFYAGDGE